VPQWPRRSRRRYYPVSGHGHRPRPCIASAANPHTHRRGRHPTVAPTDSRNRRHLLSRRIGLAFGAARTRHRMFPGWCGSHRLDCYGWNHLGSDAASAGYAVLVPGALTRGVGRWSGGVNLAEWARSQAQRNTGPKCVGAAREDERDEHTATPTTTTRRAGPPENTHRQRPTPFGPHRMHSSSLIRNGTAPGKHPNMCTTRQLECPQHDGR
jgi:hypothetical protein